MQVVDDHDRGVLRDAVVSLAGRELLNAGFALGLSQLKAPLNGRDAVGSLQHLKRVLRQGLAEFGLLDGGIGLECFLLENAAIVDKRVVSVC